jgi:hypothetical protein
LSAVLAFAYKEEVASDDFLRAEVIDAIGEDLAQFGFAVEDDFLQTFGDGDFAMEDAGSAFELLVQDAVQSS